MVMSNPVLEMKFDPNTIEHLGIQMYSSMPNALAELIANGYDAGASVVNVKLFDKDKKEIEVFDNGNGMSLDEINTKFLRIGRKKREEDGNSYNGRYYTGRKGLGKLALFGLGKNIEIITKKKDEDKAVKFTMNWDAIINTKNGPYRPEFEIAEVNFEHGTLIKLTDLKRKSPFSLEDAVLGIAKLFHFSDNKFQIFISLNNSPFELISREQKYTFSNKQFEWNIEDIVKEINDDYKYKNQLKGKIISTEKPMKASFRGVTLYANGRLANSQGFFGMSEAGHTFTYLTGWIDADFLDNLDYDVISTDRQSLNWEFEETQALQLFIVKILRLIVKKWSEGRKLQKGKDLSDKVGINVRDWIDTVPGRLQKKMENFIESVEKEESLDNESFSTVVKQLYELLPPYTDYHFRNLNEEIKKVSKDKYIDEDYYEAIRLAVIQYINCISNKIRDKKLEVPKGERKIIQNSFGARPDAIFKVASHLRKKDGNFFNQNTTDGLEEAQKTLSEGILSGYRHPLSHDLPRDIKEAGVITEQNCLDALSLLSLLFDRLEQAK